MMIVVLSLSSRPVYQSVLSNTYVIILYAYSLVAIKDTYLNLLLLCMQVMLLGVIK